MRAEKNKVLLIVFFIVLIAGYVVSHEITHKNDCVYLGGKATLTLIPPVTYCSGLNYERETLFAIESSGVDNITYNMFFIFLLIFFVLLMRD